jgi:hypothetical protein
LEAANLWEERIHLLVDSPLRTVPLTTPSIAAPSPYLGPGESPFQKHSPLESFKIKNSPGYSPVASPSKSSRQIFDEHDGSSVIQPPPKDVWWRKYVQKGPVPWPDSYKEKPTDALVDHVSQDTQRNSPVDGEAFLGSENGNNKDGPHESAQVPDQLPTDLTSDCNEESSVPLCLASYVEDEIYASRQENWDIQPESRIQEPQSHESSHVFLKTEDAPSLAANVPEQDKNTAARVLEQRFANLNCYQDKQDRNGNGNGNGTTPAFEGNGTGVYKTPNPGSFKARRPDSRNPRLELSFPGSLRSLYRASPPSPTFAPAETPEKTINSDDTIEVPVSPAAISLPDDSNASLNKLPSFPDAPSHMPWTRSSNGMKRTVLILPKKPSPKRVPQPVPRKDSLTGDLPFKMPLYTGIEDLEHQIDVINRHLGRQPEFLFSKFRKAFRNISGEIPTSPQFKFAPSPKDSVPTLQEDSQSPVVPLPTAAPLQLQLSLKKYRLSQADEGKWAYISDGDSKLSTVPSPASEEPSDAVLPACPPPSPEASQPASPPASPSSSGTPKLNKVQSWADDMDTDEFRCGQLFQDTALPRDRTSRPKYLRAKKSHKITSYPYYKTVDPSKLEYLPAKAYVRPEGESYRPPITNANSKHRLEDLSEKDRLALLQKAKEKFLAKQALKTVDEPAPPSQYPSNPSKRRPSKPFNKARRILGIAENEDDVFVVPVVGEETEKPSKSVKGIFSAKRVRTAVGRLAKGISRRRSM